MQLWNKSLNCDGKQFHQYQQNEHSLLTANHWRKKTQKTQNLSCTLTFESGRVCRVIDLYNHWKPWLPLSLHNSVSTLDGLMLMTRNVPIWVPYMWYQKVKHLVDSVNYWEKKPTHFNTQIFCFQKDIFYPHIL